MAAQAMKWLNMHTSEMNLDTWQEELEEFLKHNNGYSYPYTDEVSVPKQEVKCECGVDKTGGGPRHSTWCPKYKEE